MIAPITALQQVPNRQLADSMHLSECLKVYMYPYAIRGIYPYAYCLIKALQHTMKALKHTITGPITALQQTISHSKIPSQLYASLTHILKPYTKNPAAAQVGEGGWGRYKPGGRQQQLCQRVLPAQWL